MFSKCRFPVDKQAEPIGMRHLGRLRIVLHLLNESVGHGGKAERAQAFDGGMNGYDGLLINYSNRDRGYWNGICQIKIPWKSRSAFQCRPAQQFNTKILVTKKII
jgi:hypothetical protein